MRTYCHQTWILATFLLLCGCTGPHDPDLFRQQAKHTYALVVPGAAAGVHKRLVSAAFVWGWAECGPIHQEFYEEHQAGSVWVQPGDSSPSINGWIIDVQGEGQSSRLTVYAWNGAFEDSTRRMIAKAFRLEAQEQ